MRTVIRLSLVAAGLLTASDLRAQQVSELRGRVVEAGSRVPVENVALRLEGPRDASAISDADGRWVVDALPAGEYRITTERLGFGARTVTVRVPLPEALTVALTPDALPLEALVVTAARRMQRLADVPVTTELILREDIERSGASDLSTVLVERTGIQLEGGHPAGEGIMLQGLGSERVLILLDGQPLVGRISGQIDLSRIPAAMVERVEVVKGSQSSLYGSEAMGGVVNVITREKSPEQWNLALDATAGSQGRTDADATLRGTLGSAYYVLGGGRRSTELTPGMSTEQGTLAERWDVLAKVGLAPAASLRIDANVLLLDERQRWQAGQLFTFADNRQFSGQLAATWTHGAHRLTPALYLSQFDHHSRRATSPEPAEGTGEEEVQRLLEAEVVYNVASGAFALDAGVEAKREETTSDRVRGRERTMHAFEPFAQATIALGGSSIVPGVRLSVSEQWGTHFSPRLAGLHRVAPDVALRASVGRGFRAPAFKELYMQFLNVGPGYGYTVRGNEDLRPETSTNVTAGVEWAPGSAYLRAQVFRNGFDDFIESRLEGDSLGIQVFTYANVAKGLTRGLDVEGGIRRGALRVEGGYGYLEARDEATDLALLGRPRHSGHLGIEHSLPFGIRSSVTGLYTGSTPIDRTETAVIERDGYLRFDARLSRALPGGLEISLGARNVLDEQPENWPGFSGRHLYATLGWGAAAALEALR